MGSEIEDIKGKLNIVDVLGEYLRLDKAGSNWRALCPFHNEKSPSFMVNEERQMWKCFGCGKGGDIFSFVMEIEGLEFREALKTLAEKAGVKLQGYSPQKTKEKNRIGEILELATKFYEVQLWKGEGKEKILSYLRERGLKDETIKEFRLGYAPRGWRNALSFLLKRGYKADEIMRTGLLVQKAGAQIQNPKSQNTQYKIPDTNYYDRFRDRIMFPIADYSGRVVGYSARVAPGGDESQAKYVNTPETEMYHKSKILYGIDKARMEIKKRDWVLLVEGNMDVIAASQAGIKNVIAVSGTALTEEQINIIKRYTKNIKMFFDMDSAGQLATRKSIKLCFAAEMNVKIVELSAGKDAADIAREDPRKLLQAIRDSKGAMEYVLLKAFSRFDKSEAEGKKKIAADVLDMIASVENEVEKSYWIKKLSQDLEINETALTDALKKANLRNRTRRNESAEEIAGSSDGKNYANRKKIEILADEIIGLMLSFQSVWKRVVEKEAAALAFSKDSLLNVLVKDGQSLDFDFEKLEDFLRKEGKEEDKTRAEKLYFEKKYRLDLNNSLEEVFVENPLLELEQIVKGIEIEMKREKLLKITTDLKMAEEKKDLKAVGFLRSEFKKISDEIFNLGQ
ncbi:MAG: primase [Patescibacteria group bacterium]|nr:primase [Patescibacteria group bacterium]